jgi:hypothetical protein
VPPALKRIILKDPLHGPEGPFFHHFFALKREEHPCASWQIAFVEERAFAVEVRGRRAALDVEDRGEKSDQSCRRSRWKSGHLWLRSLE